MSVEKTEAAAESRLQWLDEELREAKAALHKVEHELEQALSQIWNLDTNLRKLEKASGDREGASTLLGSMQEDIRQLRGQADKLQERQNAQAARAEELSRQQQSDLEKDRQERATLLSQTETAGRTVGQFDSRVQLLEDSLRKVDEGVAGVRLGQETLRRDIEELINRTARNLEAATRLDHLVDGLAKEVEALYKRDVEVLEKVSLAEERVQNAEERLSKFEETLKLPLEMKEQLDRGRFERQQLAERLNRLEALATQISEQTAEYVQGLARVDHRSQALTARVEEIGEAMRGEQEALLEQMKRLLKTMERQRRRQVDALTQEIKELSRSEPKTER
jgi:chromosome segregation ATPase